MKECIALAMLKSAMLKLVWGVAFVAGAALVIGGCRSPNGNETSGDVPLSVGVPAVREETVLSNATVGSRIMESFSREPKLKDAQIGVSISNLDNSITLTGMVPQASQRLLAVKLAQKQAPKRRVISRLEVKSVRAVKQGKKQSQPQKGTMSTRMPTQKPLFKKAER